MTHLYALKYQSAEYRIFSLLIMLIAGLNSSFAQSSNFQLGIEVLRQQSFAPFRGKRIGLITNQTGIDSRSRSDIDLLANAPEVKLVMLFSPEHGIRGVEDHEGIQNTIDSATGIPVMSLYGKNNAPTDSMLSQIDILIYDIQDVGARYYTYTTTMALCMEAAARCQKPFYVLDRPNPIRDDIVEGDILEDSLKSFVGHFNIPTRYGFTIGELAFYHNNENHLNADLTVIPMSGYTRRMWFDELSLPWVNPSPNLRSLPEEILYSGLCPFEATNLSVGRGTETPFEIYGAPYLNSRALADTMNAWYFQGAEFEPVDFVPASGTFKGIECHGVKIKITNRDIVRSTEIFIKLAHAIHQQSAEWNYHTRGFLKLTGSGYIVRQLDENGCPCSSIAKFMERRKSFEEKNKQYFLYPSDNK